MFQDYLGFIVPETQNSNKNQILSRYIEKQNLINEKIKEQYVDLRHLGIDDLKDENNIDNDIYIELLSFINDNYIPLVHLEYVLHDDKKIQQFGYSCYRLLVVDLLNDILPKICIKNKIVRSEELLTIDIYPLQNMMMDYIESKLNNLRKIKYTTMSQPMRLEIMINMFFLDILDNNIEQLVSKFIHPMICKYEDLLDSKIL